MKFHNLNDIKIFLVEVNEFDMVETVDINFLPSKELEEEFVKRRQGLIKNLRNFRKSQDQKQNWRQNRNKLKLAIKRFHRSTEGKKMHRNLGRFLATRVFKERSTNEGIDYSIVLNEASETLKAISSLKTHMFIEAEYYAPLKAQLLFEELLIDTIPYLSKMENNLLLNGDITNEELGVLTSLIDPIVLLQEIAVAKEVDSEAIEKKVKYINVKENKDENTFSIESLYKIKEVI